MYEQLRIRARAANQALLGSTTKSYLTYLQDSGKIEYKFIDKHNEMENKRFLRRYIMAAKIAINGFGRIGRLSFRKMFDDDRFDIVAINDLASTEMLAYLLKYDSVQRTFEHKVDSDDENIYVDGKQIKVYKEADPAKLPWGELGIDIVLECTGFFASKAKSQAHIDAGAKKVVISAPAGDDLPTIVYGVNEQYPYKRR